MNKAPITTHILDLHRGKPATGVLVKLYSSNASESITSATTDDDGRIMQWQDAFQLSPGVWRLKFGVAEWFDAQKRPSFFADVELAFKVEATDEHYHVPLLLNEFGYSSYRGS